MWEKSSGVQLGALGSVKQTVSDALPCVSMGSLQAARWEGLTTV